MRSDFNFVPAGRLGIPRDHVEESRYIRSQSFVASEITDIGIQPCRPGIVVSSAEMHVTLDPLAFPAYHQAGFPMRLVSSYAVKNGGARRDQTPRPFDIVF